MPVDATDFGTWFEAYLVAFGAYIRGDAEDPKALLAFYNVPLLLTTDNGFLALTTEDDVKRAIRQQTEGMRAAGYDRSNVLDSEISILNSVAILYRGDFSRLRRDGSEIERLRVTYLVVQTAIGPRIAALVVHSA